MHGEYKVPGGKLVVADLDVVDDVVRRAQISGDFFLEPDDAPGTAPIAISARSFFSR
jgi:lipoate-protein ligase A